MRGKHGAKEIGPSLVRRSGGDLPHFSQVCQPLSPKRRGTAMFMTQYF